MITVVNAFSVSMLRDAENETNVKFTPLTVTESQILLQGNEYTSAIGHADTAKMLSSILNAEIAFNRISVKMVAGDVLLLAQYVGPRLPEGTTTLPKGAYITFYKVEEFNAPSWELVKLLQDTSIT